MLAEDTTAFIEQLEVARDDKRAGRRRHRRDLAEIDVLRAEWERRLAADAVSKMEQELAELVDPAEAGPGRRLLLARRRRALAHRISVLRARSRTMEAEVLAARERLRELDRQSTRELPAHGAKVFRLHSARHHLECSERRFAKLARAQTDRPVLVGKTDGRRWWWYLDRFWWDDDGLDARAVQVIVLDTDLLRKQHAASIAEARAAILGEEPRPPAFEPVSQVVRFAVWCRDRGCCVDCGTAEAVGFDEILPPESGGSRTAANVELRCAGCRERRELNQNRALVARARVAAASLVA